jgi:hypothetical protein
MLTVAYTLFSQSYVNLSYLNLHCTELRDKRHDGPKHVTDLLQVVPTALYLVCSVFMKGHWELSGGTPIGNTAITLEFKTRLET